MDLYHEKQLIYAEIVFQYQKQTSETKILKPIERKQVKYRKRNRFEIERFDKPVIERNRGKRVKKIF